MSLGPLNDTGTPGAAASSQHLLDRIQSKKASVAIIGLGYVGLPLALAAAQAGYTTLGFDIDPAKPAAIAARRSYISSVATEDLAVEVDAGRLTATTDMARLTECDVIAICVPTPLTANRTPDLSFVSSTAHDIARALRPDGAAAQLVVLESTTYPGTTEEVIGPILAAHGARLGESVFLAYSPEREDPGRTSHNTQTIPKVVAGVGEDAARLAQQFYKSVVEDVVAVSSVRTAEAVKLFENIFRSVNIALVNELKLTFDAMDIDIWEVVAAASTKPFGFMPFYPGPGLGGHCIPIDPFYLTWKAREYGQATRFVELAGEINQAMPTHVLARLERGVDEALGRGLSASRVLVVGAAYKKNVSDVRESPALRLMALLAERRATVSFHDPHVPEIPPTREYGALRGLASVPLSPETLDNTDVAVIVTDHDAVDYSALGASGVLIVDTRNAMRSRGVACKGRLILA